MPKLSEPLYRLLTEHYTASQSHNPDAFQRLGRSFVLYHVYDQQVVGLILLSHDHLISGYSS
jgi:hypothetical protein